MTIEERLEKIERMLATLVERHTIQDWCSSPEVARLLAKAECIVRERCHRTHPRTKKPCSRGIRRPPRANAHRATGHGPGCQRPAARPGSDLEGGKWAAPSVAPPTRSEKSISQGDGRRSEAFRVPPRLQGRGAYCLTDQTGRRQRRPRDGHELERTAGAGFRIITQDPCHSNRLPRPEATKTNGKGMFRY